MTEPAKQWFSKQDLVGMPGLPATNFGIAKKAKRENWNRLRLNGSGWTYHISCLPQETQAFIQLERMKKNTAAKTDSTNKTCKHLAYDPESLWLQWEKASDSMKDKAKQKYDAVRAVCELIQSGAKKGDALRYVASELSSTKPEAIRKWMGQVKDVSRNDWLPALLDKNSGSNNYAHIEPESWDYFKADYLRVEAPAATAVYRRLKRVAKVHGWKVPSLKSFLRKLERELPKQVIILAREGKEALERTYPAQERDHAFFHALEAVNADGHKFDVFVKWPDGEIYRPVMVTWQDVYSGKILSYRVDKSENAEIIRLSYLDLIDRYGIITHTYFDNGRGFASKWMTGRVKNRYRFKIKEEDPAGVIPLLGTEVHWCMVRHGQSKPVERSFLDLAENVSKHPRFAGAYTGKNPNAKPENYGSKAIPLDVFLKVLKQEMAAHNARKGRRSKVCNGRSFDEVFNESYQQATIRKATAAQRRLLLLAAESVTVSRQDGSVWLDRNRYYCEQLFKYAGQKIVIRFDPEKLHSSVYAYELNGKFIAEAECVLPAGFGDINAAKDHNRERNRQIKANKRVLKAERRMSALEAAELLPDIDPSQIPNPKTVKVDFRSPDRVLTEYGKEERDDLFGKGMKKIVAEKRAAND